MAITKIQSESLNLADTYAFTGTVTGAGGDNKPMFSAKTSGGTSLGQNANTLIAIATEEFDIGGCYNNTSSSTTLNGLTAPAYSFTPNVAGKYYVKGVMRISSDTDFDICDMVIFKNGSNVKRFSVVNRRYNSAAVSAVIDMNGTGDYVQIYVYTNQSGISTYTGETDTYFTAHKLID